MFFVFLRVEAPFLGQLEANAPGRNGPVHEELPLPHTRSEPDLNELCLRFANLLGGVTGFESAFIVNVQQAKVGLVVSTLEKNQFHR